MAEFGLYGSPVNMMISFGKGSTAWTNYTRTDLVKSLQPEIKRFGRTLRTINKLEFFFLFIPISKVLKWFGYSEEFCNHMVFPLTALFFGTGNQTPQVSAAIVARVFLDDDLRLFDYDSECLLSQSPEMFAFPNLREMYATIIRKINVRFFPSRPIASVKRQGGRVLVVDEKGVSATFDEIIFTCNAETVLKVLHEPSWLERRALGSVRYYNDVTITHEDDKYMERHYELHRDIDQYFIRTDPTDPSKLEMSFNLSNYQPNLKAKKYEGGDASGRNIYQTIFLDDATKEIWTKDEIDTSKIRLVRWWRQFSHTWRHFAFSVPLMRYLHGKGHVWYAGSYTLINTHEVAIVSGFAAASRLGAPYPFPEDQLASDQFDQYLLLIHGKARHRGCNCATLKSILLAPMWAILAGLALFLRLIMACMGKDV